MSIIPANQLQPAELFKLGNNTAQAVRDDRASCQASRNPTPLLPRPDEPESDDQVEAAMRSEHVAS